MPHRPRLSTRTPALLLLLAALLVGWLALPATAQDPATPDPTAQPDAELPTLEEAEQPEVPGTDEPGADAEEVAEAAGEAESKDWTASLNEALNGSLGKVNGFIFKYLFFDISFSAFDYKVTDTETGAETAVEPEVPFLVIFLALGAIFFSVWHGFLPIRGFAHSLKIVAGKYTKKTDEGDISPFRALTSALSATVGLGNIAGVAVAMVMGGPGALFWMMVLGFFGMAAKFHESTLAQLYRTKNEDGSISGGPMYYLDRGLKQLNPALGGLGKGLAIVFAVFCMMAALGGGNMFQANQSFEGFYATFVQENVAPESQQNAKLLVSIGFGLLMAALVAVVVVGGITRIGAATSKIVPFMAVLYIVSCVTIILMHLGQVPDLIGEVFRQAFNAEAAYGGFIGALIMGVRRAAFSSEAGLGSSAIAHSAAQQSEPVREGFVASLEPFIDTIVICFLTGLTVLITGAYQSTEGGSAVTLTAFQSLPGFLSTLGPWVLTVCIILFAFSTMISWCYYGERAWGYLFGIQSVLAFRLIFVVFVFFGSVASLGAVIDFADAMLLSMAFPNIVGGIILAPMVKRKVQDYWARYKSGDFDKPDPGPDTTGADI